MFGSTVVGRVDGASVGFSEFSLQSTAIPVTRSGRQIDGAADDVGPSVGGIDGATLGVNDGFALGETVGAFVGVFVGVFVGFLVGVFVGFFVGVLVGVFVGFLVR